MTTSRPNIYMCKEVRKVRQLHADLFTAEFCRLTVEEQLKRQAQRIFDAHESGNKTVVTHIKCWHPNLTGHPTDEIMAYEFMLHDALETIAREYGFQNWSDVQNRGTKPPGQNFETAVDALLRGDTARVQKLLSEHPSLVREKSGYGHRSTLLHYVGSNGVETHRQVVPSNLAEVTRMLLDAGADVNATADMYGGGTTTMALLLTSSHPAEAGVVDDVVRALVSGGAETHA